MVALHDALEFLRVLLALPLALEHLLEGLQARHFHLRHDGPVSLGAQVGQDAHLRHSQLLVQLGHREELVDHGAYLAGLAVHDLADQQHGVSLLVVEPVG